MLSAHYSDGLERVSADRRQFIDQVEGRVTEKVHPFWGLLVT